MIIMDKEFEIKGNTVLVPERSEEEYIKERENYKRRKREMELHRKNIKMKKQVRIILGIAAIFIFGFVILIRYSEIYSLQNKLASIQNESNVIQDQNDDLRLQIFKSENIDDLTQKATGDLHMIQPDKNNAVHVDLHKNSVNYSGNTKDTSKKGVLDFIESKLF